MASSPGSTAGLTRRQSRTVALWAALFVALCCALLSGCLLISGEQTTTDITAGNGNLTTTFVSAEGSSERWLQVTDEPVELHLIVNVAVESGDLRVDVLAPDGGLAFAVESRPGSQVTRSGQVQTDADGRLRYRVAARGARNGTLQLLFQQ